MTLAGGEQKTVPRIAFSEKQDNNARIISLWNGYDAGAGSRTSSESGGRRCSPRVYEKLETADSRRSAASNCKRPAFTRPGVNSMIRMQKSSMSKNARLRLQDYLFARITRLNTSQRAALAVLQHLPLARTRAKKRQRDHGGTAPGTRSYVPARSRPKGETGQTARSEAARKAGVSPRSLQDALRVYKNDPALFRDIAYARRTVAGALRRPSAFVTAPHCL